jgi:hypothetical protein
MLIRGKTGVRICANAVVAGVHFGALLLTISLGYASFIRTANRAQLGGWR